MPIDHLAAIRSESARFGDALHAATPDQAVPSCPEWDAAELLWHLTEVQEFWCKIVAEGLSDPAEVAGRERPDGYADLHQLFGDTTERLVDVLASAGPADPVWTWASDKTAGFVLRRQAHEALIHRVDAELTAGLPVTPSKVDLAVDGIDELMEFFIGTPEWGDFTPGGGNVAIEPTDADSRWVVCLGRFSGTSPSTGKSYEGLLASRLVQEPADATVSASASDLNFWLWGRMNDVAVVGDSGAVDALRALVAESTQ